MYDGQKPLVVLDRDGVINEDSADFIKSPDEFVSLPGSIDAIGDLCRAGFRVVVATNQSGVARGLFSPATLEQIHAKLRAEVDAAGGIIAGIFICPHKPDDNCACRKPKPGLLEQIAAAFAIDLREVPVIGDSARDLDAAIAVGARPILVLTGNGRSTKEKLGKDQEIAVYENLAAAAAALVESMDGV